MRSVNKVILIGNLTRSPELKTTTSGQSIVSFGIATNRQWTTSTGEKRDSAEFHEIIAWSRLAEICQQYLKKGMLVYVEGYLKTRSWDMEDGTRRFKTEIVANDMIILEKRGNRDDYDMDLSEGTSLSEMAEAPKAPAAEPAETAAAPAAPAPETSTQAAPATPEAPAPGNISADIDDDNMF